MLITRSGEEVPGNDIDEQLNEGLWENRGVIRRLIPLERPLVVLDTGPARFIAEEVGRGQPEPDWVRTFVKMRDAGYAFCLADGAFAELLTGRSEDRICDAGYAQMIMSLRRFLEPELPVLLGRADVMAMLGLRKQQKHWRPQEVMSLSRRAMVLLSSAKPGCDGAAKELEAERADYKGAFKVLEDFWKQSTKVVPLHEFQHPQLDLALARLRVPGRIIPDMDVRNDLQIRWLWRQFVRSQKPKHPYDPESESKRNDGIDFDLYRYLALPAFVVSDDGGFFERIEDIKSIQKAWFWRPENLAAAFERGERPVPTWPAATPLKDRRVRE